MRGCAFHPTFLALILQAFFYRFDVKNRVLGVSEPLGASAAFRRTEPGRTGNLTALAPGGNNGRADRASALGCRLNAGLGHHRQISLTFAAASLTVSGTGT